MAAAAGSPSRFPSVAVDITATARAAETFRKGGGESGAERARTLGTLLASGKRATDALGKRLRAGPPGIRAAASRNAVTETVADIMRGGNPAKTETDPPAFWCRVVARLFGQSRRAR